MRHACAYDTRAVAWRRRTYGRVQRLVLIVSALDVALHNLCEEVELARSVQNVVLLLSAREAWPPAGAKRVQLRRHASRKQAGARRVRLQRHVRGHRHA